MVVEEIIGRTTMANIVASFLAIMGMIYAIHTNDVKLVTFLAGAGIGWLLKEVKK